MRKLFIFSCIGLFLSCSSSDKTEKLQNELNQLKQQHTKSVDIATKNKASVKAFFKALEKEDANAVAELFADSAVHINPYHSGLFPTGSNGKENIRNYWIPVFSTFDGMTFPIEEIYAMEDPKMVFVKYKGNVKLKDNAGVYRNDYYSTFKFDDDGKITEYVEIFNPIVAARGFGLLEKIR